MLDLIRTNLTGGETPILIGMVVALAVILLFWGLALVASRSLNPARRRLGEIAGGGAPDSGSGVFGFLVAIQPLARLLVPSQKEREGTQQQLQYAGYRAASAVATFYAAKVCSALLFLALWLLVARFLPRVTGGQVTFIALAAGFAGMIIPGIWLDRRVTARHEKLRHGFPDALDLLTVCVEAGLGLAQALDRVASELDVSHPELANEFAQVTAQMRAGVDREVALRGLATRTGLNDARGLVGLLVQTLRFGTGIAETLRVYSEDFRDKRMQLAEEAAAKMGTKLIFPLVLCMFPAFFVVAIGPAVIRLVEAFSGH